jgi:hypothetical protein
MTHKNRKRNFMFWSAGCSPVTWTSFMEISKLPFLIKKYHFFCSCRLFSIFGHQNPGSVLDSDPNRYIQLKMLDPDPDLESVNPDPKHCGQTLKPWERKLNHSKFGRLERKPGTLSTMLLHLCKNTCWIQLTNRKCRRESTLSMTLEPKLPFSKRPNLL